MMHEGALAFSVSTSHVVSKTELKMHSTRRAASRGAPDRSEACLLGPRRRRAMSSGPRLLGQPGLATPADSAQRSGCFARSMPSRTTATALDRSSVTNNEA